MASAEPTFVESSGVADAVAHPELIVTVWSGHISSCCN